MNWQPLSSAPLNSERYQCEPAESYLPTSTLQDLHHCLQPGGDTEGEEGGVCDRDEDGKKLLSLLLGRIYNNNNKNNNKNNKFTQVWMNQFNIQR